MEGLIAALTFVAYAAGIYIAIIGVVFVLSVVLK